MLYAHVLQNWNVFFFFFLSVLLLFLNQTNANTKTRLSQNLFSLFSFFFFFYRSLTLAKSCSSFMRLWPYLLGLFGHHNNVCKTRIIIYSTSKNMLSYLLWTIWRLVSNSTDWFDFDFQIFRWISRENYSAKCRNNSLKMSNGKRTIEPNLSGKYKWKCTHLFVVRFSGLSLVSSTDRRKLCEQLTIKIDWAYVKNVTKTEREYRIYTTYIYILPGNRLLRRCCLNASVSYRFHQANDMTFYAMLAYYML